MVEKARTDSGCERHKDVDFPVFYKVNVFKQHNETNMKRKQAGFTLIEIMITLGVAAIVLSFGVPKFQLMMQNNRISTSTNTLIGTFNLARSEAIKRGREITVRANGSPAQWKNGWEILDDNSGEVIRHMAALNSTMHIESTSSETEFVYLANGFFKPATDKFVFICDANRSGEFGRVFTISLSGKARLSNREFTCS